MGHLTEKEEQRIKDVAIAVGWREPFTTLDGDTIYGTAPGWIGSGKEELGDRKPSGELK